MKNDSTSTKKNLPKKPPVMLMLVSSVAAGFLGGWVAGRPNQSSLTNASNQTKQQIVSTEEAVISQVAKDVGDSVVSIDVTGVSRTTDFFGFSNNVQSQAAGTGVIVSDSVIVTNKHVVPEGTSSVKVTLSDGTVLDAEILARDPRNDIAFVKVKDKKGKTLKPAKLGDSTKLQVGQKVIAIGNALGQFQNTVTTGIVSGYGRSITAGQQGDSEDLTNLIQTDAAINEGNSGGPLVNLSGEVIGINTAITSSSTGQSLGFSIPISDITAQISSVLSSGKIERPYLGVRYQPITEKYAYIYNLPVKTGAYIPPSETGASSIVKDSPADKSGLKEKDIITKIDDQELNEKNDLVSVLGKHKVGDVVKLTILRDGNEQTIDVKLEATPGS
jgi:serine protease Do